MLRRSTSKIHLQKVIENEPQRRVDHVAVEEPLEIRLSYHDQNKHYVEQSVSITMRTPGEDFALAAGFLFTEGIIHDGADISQISYCVRRKKEKQHYNSVAVTLKPGVRFESERLARHFYTTSSCGVCGKASLDSLRVQGCQALPDRIEITAELISYLPKTLRKTQATFDKTGGLHAAALFNNFGKLMTAFEDVGRHNAVDKLIGECVLSNKMPLSENLLLVSGRASFEIIQKALVAGIPIVAAVGAPSSLAVALAEEFNMTLVGFVRDGSFNIYTGARRILCASAGPR